MSCLPTPSLPLHKKGLRPRDIQILLFTLFKEHDFFFFVQINDSKLFMHGTIHLRCRQIFMIFDPYPPLVGNLLLLSVGKFDQLWHQVAPYWNVTKNKTFTGPRGGLVVKKWLTSAMSCPSLPSLPLPKKRRKTASFSPKLCHQVASYWNVTKTKTFIGPRGGLTVKK